MALATEERKRSYFPYPYFPYYSLQEAQAFQASSRLIKDGRKNVNSAYLSTFEWDFKMKPPSLESP